MPNLRHILAFAPTLLAGGCATLPGLPEENRAPIGALIERVQCEMKAAYVANVERHPWLRRWASAFTLTLTRADTRSLSASGSATQLFTGGLFKVSGSLDASEVGTETGILSFKFALSELEFVNCESLRFAGVNSYFTGSTGFEHWFNRVSDSIDANPDDAVKKPTEFSHQLTFKITGGGKLVPSWVWPTATAGGDIAAARAETYDLKVAFVQIPGDPKPAEVFVTNFPKWMRDGGAVPARPAGASTPTPFSDPSLKRDTPKATPRPPRTRVLPKATLRTFSKPLDDETVRRLDRALERLDLRRQ